MRASSCAIGAWNVRVPAPGDPAAGAPALARTWCIASAVAAGIFALGAPTSIFLAQVGIFACLALALAHPRLALRPLVRHPELGAALVFYFLVQLASIVYSQHPLRSLICLRGDWPVVYLPILLAVLQVRAARRVAWVTVLLAAAVAGVIGLIQNTTGVDPLGRTALEADGSGRFHAIGTLRGHLTYGGVMLAGFAAAFALLIGASGRRRVGILLVTAACGVGLITSYARSALLGAVVGAVAATAATLAAGRRGREHRLRALIPAVLIAAGGVLAIAFLPGLLARFAGLGEFGSDPRSRLWGTALRIFADFPLFGAGLGSFKSHFPLYRLPGDYMATGHPHSDLLNVLVHSGLAGLLAWIALWWAVLRAAWVSGRGVLAIAIVAAFLTAGLLQCYFTDEEPAAMLWLLLALAISEGASKGASEGEGERDAAGEPKPPGGHAPAGRQRWLARFERSSKRALLPLAVLFFVPRARRQPPAQPKILSGARRILLIRQDNRLGNLVLITPFLQALRAAAPGAHLGLLVGSRFADVLAGAPWIDELLLMHKRRLIHRPWTYPAHLAAIRSGRWDIAIDLSNPDTHSFYSAFAPLVSGAAWRVGFDHPLSRRALSVVVSPPEPECHYALAPLLLLSALGADPQQHPLRLSPALLERAGVQTADAHPAAAGPIVVHPGGRGAKQWPAEAFAAVARALTDGGLGPVRVIGGRGDQALLAHLENELPGSDVRVIADLEGLVAALADARLYIGCDAGPLHVAAALGVPALALFLTSHPLRYGPLGERNLTLVLGEGSRAWLREALDPAGSPARGPRAAPPAGGPIVLTPATHVTRALSARRPRLVVAPSGLDLPGQIALVCAQARRCATTQPGAQGMRGDRPEPGTPGLRGDRPVPGAQGLRGDRPVPGAPDERGPTADHSPLERDRANAEDRPAADGESAARELDRT